MKTYTDSLLEFTLGLGLILGAAAGMGGAALFALVIGLVFLTKAIVQDHQPREDNFNEPKVDG